MGCTSSSNKQQTQSPQSEPLYDGLPVSAAKNVIPALPKPSEDVPTVPVVTIIPDALPVLPKPSEDVPVVTIIPDTLPALSKPSEDVPVIVNILPDTLPAVAVAPTMMQDQEPSNFDDQNPHPVKVERGNEKNAEEGILITPSYIFCVDASVKMVYNQQYADNGEIVFDKLWHEAQTIVSSLVPEVAKDDPEGVKVVFFSHTNKTTSYSGIRTPEQANALFGANENKLKGGRELYGPLQRIILDKSDSRPAAVIVLLVDALNDAYRVKKLLSSAAASDATRPFTVSFIEVGETSAALKNWMQSLSDEVALKSIVNVTTASALLMELQ
eukprot:gene34310-44316_t